MEAFRSLPVLTFTRANCDIDTKHLLFTYYSSTRKFSALSFSRAHTTRIPNMTRLSVLLALAAAPLSAFVLPEGPWEHHWAVIVAG